MKPTVKVHKKEECPSLFSELVTNKDQCVSLLQISITLYWKTRLPLRQLGRGWVHRESRALQRDLQLGVGVKWCLWQPGKGASRQEAVPIVADRTLRKDMPVRGPQVSAPGRRASGSAPLPVSCSRRGVLWEKNTLPGEEARKVPVPRSSVSHRWLPQASSSHTPELYGASGVQEVRGKAVDLLHGNETTHITQSQLNVAGFSKMKTFILFFSTILGRTGFAELQVWWLDLSAQRPATWPPFHGLWIAPWTATKIVSIRTVGSWTWTSTKCFKEDEEAENMSSLTVQT